MSDVVKAVAIGALVGLTGGAALGFIAPALVGGAVTFAGVYGGVYTISAVAVGAVSGAVLGGLQAGLSAVAAEFADKPSMDTRDAEARLNVSLNPDSGGKWIFGETAAATDLMYAEKVGDTYLTQVMACAAHTVESFGTLYLNGETISFSGSSATGQWAGVLDRYTNLGTSGQAALGGVGSWPSDANGAGIAHMKLDYTAGEDKIKNGIPTRVSQVIKGAPVYDPRLDSTRGGSGTHRADDQSTWEYNDGTDDIGANWALVVTFYLLGWYENGDLIFGVGVDPDDVDWDSVVTAANICDATVDSKPRYRVGGVFLTSNDHERVIQQLEAAIMGKVAKVGGKYYIWAPSDDLTSQGNIGEDAVLRDFGVEFSPSGPIRGLYNTARGRYVSPAELYQFAPYPQVVESTAVTEDGRARIKHHDFAIIQDVEIAERVARMMVRRSRFTGQWRLAVGPVGLLYRQFDVVTINIRETNNTDQLVRITDMTVRTDGVVILDLLEEDSSIYNTADALGTPVTQQDPAAHDPSESISLTGLTVTAITYQGSNSSASNAFKVAWGDPGGYVERTEVQYRIDGDTDWTPAAPSRVDFTDALLGPLEGGTLYDVRARHITAFGVAGAWVSTQQTASNAAAFPFGKVSDPIAGQNLLGSSAGTEVSWTATNSVVGTLNLADIAADPGGVVSVSAQARSATGADQVRLELRYYLGEDAGGTTIRTDTSSVIQSSTYGTISIAASEIPATALSLRVFLRNLNETETAYRRRAMLNLGPTALPFEEPPARVGRGEVDEGADVTADNPQPPSWLTALIAAGDIDAASVEAVLNAINLINGPDEAGAEKTTGKSLAILIDRVADNIDESAGRKWGADSGATLSDHARLRLTVNHSCPDAPTVATAPIDDWTLTRSPTGGWTVTVVPGGEEIELDDAGDYLLTVLYTHEADDAGGFVSIDAEEKPSGGSWAAVPASRGLSPSRLGNGGAGLARFEVEAAAANHRVRIRGWRDDLAASTATIQATDTVLLIERLRI